MDLPPIVTTDLGLAAWMAHLEPADLVGVDMEANGFHAYVERVCLIQISTRQADCVIDPLAVRDLAPLGRWLANPSITKIMHGAEFDVTSFKRDFGFEVHGLFDTMHAARLLGLEKLGLSALAAEIAGVKLDKRYQRHDWGRRPLDRAAIEYARRDSQCLLPIHDDLAPRLEAAGLAEAAKAAFAKVEASRGRDRAFDADGFKRLKGYGDLNGEGRRAVRELWLIREEVAEAKDSAPFRVLSPATLIELAARLPRGKREFEQAKGVSRWLAATHGDRIAEAIRGASSKPDPGPAPRRPRRRRPRRS